MRVEQRAHHLREQVHLDDGLDAQLSDALLAAHLADRRRRALLRQERPGAGRVPRAALVVSDPPRARTEDRIARRFESLARHEPDELVLLHPGTLRHGRSMTVYARSRSFSFSAASEDTAIWIAAASRI